MSDDSTQTLESGASAQPFRAGYASLLGRPNVGKSTLLNALVGSKLAAVTSKPQTTRNRISGILTTSRAQFVFLDTPGVVEPRYRLQQRMVKMAFDAARDADLVLYVIDASTAPHRADDVILQQLPGHRGPVLLVLNKIDRIAKPLLLPILDEYGKRDLFAEMVPVAARRGEGLNRLLDCMEKYLPESPMLFPPDQMSELPERFFVAETIREKVFLRTRQEVPYASSVVIEEFVAEEGANRIYIRASIYVERANQKMIVVGRGGEMLKSIGQSAREDIEQFLGTKVFLDLWVGVREGWREKDAMLREFGYE
ncbi:GTPase Era [Candidatus Poribacteria bacterium]|nr:GTPase Era [Candidatus Poribacteria bacterium]